MLNLIGTSCFLALLFFFFILLIIHYLLYIKNNFIRLGNLLRANYVKICTISYVYILKTSNNKKNMYISYIIHKFIILSLNILKNKVI